MFNIKKTQRAGQCAAMRCKEPATDLLCARHEEEWRGLGSPPIGRELATQPAAPAREADPKAGLAVLEPTRVEMEAERHKAQEALQLIAALPVETEEDRAAIAQYINLTAAEIKRLEDKRKSVVQPLNQIVKTVNSWFSPAVEFYTQAKAMLGNKLAERIRQLEAKRTEALAEIQAGGGDASPAAFLAAHGGEAAPSGVTTRRKLKWHVIDFRLIPEEYLTKVVNKAIVDDVVDRQGMQATIPGIEIFEEITVGAGRGGPE